jgi:hypothetical protein
LIFVRVEERESAHISVALPEDATAGWIVDPPYVPLDTGALINVPTAEDDGPEGFDPLPNANDLKVIAETEANDDDDWEVGDPINAPTAHGYPSWSTAKSRYWKNRAQGAEAGEFSEENLARMMEGSPPLHDELGVAMELHHIAGRDITDPHNINNLQEYWPWEHDENDPYRHYRGPTPT